MPHTAEVTSSQSTWTAFDLQRYLLSLSYHDPEHDFTLPHTHFPKRIALSETWHETFERMRRIAHEQNRETWCLVGVTAQRDRVLISRDLVYAPESDPFNIRPDDIDASIAQAAKQGVPYFVADIHTHLKLDMPKVRKKLFEDEFSGGDLEEFLDSKTQPAMMFLVGPTKNGAVFRSQDTELIEVYVYDHKDYELFWSGQKQRSLHNRIIADKHRLALYTGQPNAPLYRVFP